MEIIKERVYDTDQHSGYRILVDRVWPRGVKKADLAMDLWAKDITPSPDLRKWFNHESDKFEKFREKYRKELTENKEFKTFIKEICDKNEPIIFLFAAKDPIHNHVNVLIDCIEEDLKGH